MNSLQSINKTLQGIIVKEKKMEHASTPLLKKEYKKQLKASKNYLKSLYRTLEQEMYEEAEAEFLMGQVHKDE